MYSRADVYVPQCTPGAQGLRRPLLVWAMAGGLALTLVGLIVSAPLLLAHNHEVLAQAIYQSFSRVCHQIPERSFQVAGHSFAVCARCTGLYVGLAAGILLFPLVHSLRRTLPAPARLWLLLAAAPTALDFSLGFFGLWQNTHLSRFLTATLLGAVSAFYIVPGLIDLSRTNFRRFFARAATRRRDVPEDAHNRASEQSAPSDYSWPSSRI
ncbi:MAG TPA: DUF2085 domain-containing protein [Pyrinomonadaceae bacterium]|jgi:uncharacterized membrane protein